MTLIDDTQAMAVYDSFTADEQRNVFRTVWLAVAAYRHTGDVEHLTGLAGRLHGMAVLESQHPDAREKIRDAAKRKAARKAGGVVDTTEVIRQLIGSGEEAR